MGLTAKQKSDIDEAIAPLVVSAMRTDPIDRDAAVAAFDAAYAALDLPAPEYGFCASPLEAFRRLEKVVPIFDEFRETLGDEAYLCGFDWTMPEIREARLNPLWRPAGLRAEKCLESIPPFGGVVESALEKSATPTGPWELLDYGNVCWWGHIDKAVTFEAASALGIYRPPQDFVLACRALQTCGWAFAFERLCLICERPESLHHPELSKEGPRDRIIVRWRDGFVCDEELDDEDPEV